MAITFPVIGPVAPVMISTLSKHCLGREMAARGIAAPTSASTGATFLMLTPFTNPEPALITKVWWYNGVTVAGNVDCGVFDENGVKLVSAGSTVMAGASAIQNVDVTDTYIGRGRFYLALATNNTTATFFYSALGTAALARAVGVASATVVFPLPATLTLATAVYDGTFVHGISLRTLVV